MRHSPALQALPVALLLAVLAFLSGALGSHVLSFGIGAAPGLGLYAIPAGLLFGAVIAFAVNLWGGASRSAALFTVAATTVAWEAAVNLAMQLDSVLLPQIGVPPASRMAIAGVAAGTLGAFSTWAGAAYAAPALQTRRTLHLAAVAGGTCGLLLSVSNAFDQPALLLIPWQMVQALIIGLGLQPSEPIA